MEIRLLDVISVFMVLFAVIDITGSIPYILELKRKSGKLKPAKPRLLPIPYSVVFVCR